MIKRYIGIDIERSCLSAVQLTRTDRQFCIEKVFSRQINENSDSVPNILETLTSKHGFDRRAGIAVSMQDDAVFFRSLKTDFLGDEHTRTISKSALEHNFPMQPNNIVAQICPHKHLEGENTSVLIAAAKKDSLYERIDTLKTAKMCPDRVEARIFAVHSTVMINHPEMMTGRTIIAYINESYLTLAIVKDSRTLMVRNIPFVSYSNDNSHAHQQQVAKQVSYEAEITWQKVFGNSINADATLYLAKGNNVSDDLVLVIAENFNCRIVAVDPYAKVINSSQQNDPPAICVAQGLALGLLLPGEVTGINFLEVEKSSIKPTVNMKKEIAIYAILLAAIAAISIGGLFLRLSRLESKYVMVKNEINEVFRQTLPQEKNIVNPLVQLDQKLQSVQKSYTLFSPVSTAGLGPLEIFHTISTSVPSKTIISSMLINTDSVRLTGSCQSFELVYSWQRSLEENKIFANIELQNVKKDTQSQKVHFTMIISLATGGTI